MLKFVNPLKPSATKLEASAICYKTIQNPVIVNIIVFFAITS